MFASKKKTMPKIPFIHDLEKMFKTFEDNGTYDLGEKDFESLEPADHAYALQLFFVR